MIRKYVIVLIWLFATVAFVTFEIGFSYQHYGRLAKVGRPVVGTVTFLNLSNHDQASYKYEVIGRTYFGLDQSNDPNPDATVLKVGEKVVVYYDSAYASRSMLGAPKPKLSGDIGSAIIGTPIFVATFMFLLFRKELRTLYRRLNPSKIVNDAV